MPLLRHPQIQQSRCMDELSEGKDQAEAHRTIINGNEVP